MKFGAALAIWLLSTSLWARPIDPPLVALRAPQTVAAVGVVRAIESVPPAIEFEIREVIRGAGRDRLWVDVPTAVLARLAVGQEVLMVYADLRAVERKPGIYQRLERGYVVQVDGASPAIFTDHPQWRTWLGLDHATRESAATYIEDIRAGMASADPQQVNLWTAELLLRPEQRERLEARDRARLHALLEAVDTLPPVRARLLLAAAEFPGLLDRAHAERVAQQWLERSPVQVQGELYNTEEPVFAAMGLLLQQGAQTQVSVATASRWLQASNPSLAEQAAWLIRKIDPTAERAAILAALGDPLLPAATRSLLVDHLRRLNAAPGGQN